MGRNRPRWAWPSSFRFEEHEGEWIVLVDDAVVDTGRNLSACLARVRTKHPHREPFVIKLAHPHVRPPVPSRHH